MSKRDDDKKKKGKTNYLASKDVRLLSPISISQELLQGFVAATDTSKLNDKSLQQWESVAKDAASNQFGDELHGRTYTKLQQLADDHVLLQDNEFDLKQITGIDDSVGKNRLVGISIKIKGSIKAIETQGDAELRERRQRGELPMFQHSDRFDGPERFNFLSHPRLRKHYIEFAKDNIKRQLKGTPSSDFATGLILLLSDMKAKGDKFMESIEACDILKISEPIAADMVDTFSTSIGLSTELSKSSDVSIWTLRNVILELNDEAESRGKDNVMASFRCSGCRDTLDKGIK